MAGCCARRDRSIRWTLVRDFMTAQGCRVQVRRYRTPGGVLEDITLSCPKRREAKA